MHMWGTIRWARPTRWGSGAKALVRRLRPLDLVMIILRRHAYFLLCHASAGAIVFHRSAAEVAGQAVVARAAAVAAAGAVRLGTRTQTQIPAVKEQMTRHTYSTPQSGGRSYPVCLGPVIS